MTRSSILSFTGASLLVMSMMQPSFAQEISFEEIVVTAQRREESLQDVPLSVSAFTGEKLSQLKINDPKDVSLVTPGFYAAGSRGDTNPIFAIRGIGLNDLFTNNNPTVGVYVDEVVQPYTPLLGFQMFDMERVEVLKGPQGTLYGRNTTGGAINFITKKPTEETEGYLSATYGRFDRFELEGAASGPLSDTIAVRLSGKTIQQGGGWQTNSLTGETIGKKDSNALRAQLAWSPSDNFDALLKMGLYKENSDQQLRQHLAYADAAFSFTPCQGFLDGVRSEGNCVDFLGYYDPNTDPRTVENSSVYGHEIDADSQDVSLIMNWHLPAFTVTSVSAFTAYNRESGDDSDGGGLIELDTLFKDNIEAWSQEVRLTSNDGSALSWVGGVFFSHDRLNGTALQALDDHIFHTRVDTSYTQKSTSVAAFGQADYQVSEKLRATLGLRYTYEDKSMVYNGIDLNPYGDSTLPTPVAGIDDKFDQDNLSGKIALDYTINDSLMVYASTSKGFKSGGYKAAIAFNPDELTPFMGEDIYAYEVGLKSTLMEGTLKLNAAGYYYDWKNFQAYVTEVRSGINVIVLSNAGDAEVYGLEAEIEYIPTERLSLRAAANWMNAEIVEFNTVEGTTDNTGNKLSYSPEFSFSGIVRYDLPTEDMGFGMYFMGDLSYRDRVYYSLANNLQNSQEGYWLLNARIAFTSLDDKWELAFWGKNLTDKLYVSQSYDNYVGIFPSQNFLGDPVTYGATLNYHF